MGEVEDFECFKFVLVPDDKVEDGFADQVVGHIDVADPMQEFYHPFEAGSGEVVAAQL